MDLTRAPEEITELLRWDTGSTISPDNYARLRASPLYPKTVRAFATAMLALGDADPVLDGILKDAGRNVAAMCCIHLHFSGGLTLPRLKTLCASFGLVSPGRARTMLLYLRYLRYVEPLPVTRGSAQHYTPTPAFLKAWSGLVKAVLRAMRVLEPGIEVVLSQFDKPGVFETAAKHACELILEAASQGNLESPWFRIFMHRYAGRQIVNALLTASEDDAFPPREPIPLSVTATAERFGVSRMHVRRLLNAAQKECLISRHEETVIFEDTGRAFLDLFFSTQLIRFVSVGARTLKERPDLLDSTGSGRSAAE